MFVAVNVIGNVPACVDVPLSTPPLKVTPEGNVPLSVIVGVGEPEAAGVKDPATPTVNIVLLALVNVGGVPVPVAPVPVSETVSGVDR